MISLLLLDHSSWWTSVGMVFKYLVIAAGTIAGIAICIRSYAVYFLAGWLPVVAFPLFMISVAEQPLGLFRPQPRQEQIFIYVWIGISLVELFLLWAPLIAFFVRSSKVTTKGVATVSKSGATHE